MLAIIMLTIWLVRSQVGNKELDAKLPIWQRHGMVHPLKAYRNARALSRADLARQLDVTVPTVWRWEEGHRKIDKERLPLVAERTGIAPAELRPDLAGLFAGSEAAE
jgi:DNA-binding XRE family transcriptional regulator